MNLSRSRPFLPMLMTSTCLLFLGINGLIGGALMLRDPFGAPMGLTVTALERTPFRSFTLPGLWLFIVWGLGSLITLLGLWSQPHQLTCIFRQHWAWTFTMLIGFGLFLWLTFQLFTLPAIAPIQAVLYAIALALIGLPLLPVMRQYYRV